MTNKFWRELTEQSKGYAKYCPKEASVLNQYLAQSIKNENIQEHKARSFEKHYEDKNTKLAIV